MEAIASNNEKICTNIDDYDMHTPFNVYFCSEIEFIED